MNLSQRIKCRAARRKAAREEEPFRCPHSDPLCARYGCPEDPAWRGDRR
jgi:hypothetical protein